MDETAAKKQFTERDYSQAALKECYSLQSQGLRTLEQWAADIEVMRQRALAMKDKNWRRAYLNWANRAQESLDSWAKWESDKLARARSKAAMDEAMQRASDLLKLNPPA